MTVNWERAQSTLMALATMAVAVVLVHREFAPAAGRSRSERISNWRTILPDARIIGDSNAPVKIVEFADLQCPACKDFNAHLIRLERKYGDHVAVAFVHFPLPMHPLAIPAARAAECANSQGRFAVMVDTLYSGQSSFGTRPWGAFARAAGVPDSAAFAVCMSDTLTTPRIIVAGRTVGQKFQVNGTPTVLVNDWRFGSTPTDTEIEEAIVKALKARAHH